MTIQNFDGCITKLRAFRDNLQSQLQVARDFYEGLPQRLRAKWDHAADFGGAIIKTLPTPALLEMFKQGQEHISKANPETDDLDRTFAAIVAYQIVISELGPRLDAAIEGASGADQIETEASALEEERPDFDEDSDYDRAVSEGFVASKSATA